MAARTLTDGMAGSCTISSLAGCLLYCQSSRCKVHCMLQLDATPDRSQVKGILPRTMPSSRSRILAPSSRMPECMYSFVTHCLTPRILLAVS